MKRRKCKSSRLYIPIVQALVPCFSGAEETKHRRGVTRILFPARLRPKHISPLFCFWKSRSQHIARLAKIWNSEEGGRRGENSSSVDFDGLLYFSTAKVPPSNGSICFLEEAECSKSSSPFRLPWSYFRSVGRERRGKEEKAILRLSTGFISSVSHQDIVCFF
jgi:hypothetical protein